MIAPPGVHDVNISVTGNCNDCCETATCSPCCDTKEEIVKTHDIALQVLNQDEQKQQPQPIILRQTIVVQKKCCTIM